MARQNVFLEMEFQIDEELRAVMCCQERGRRGFVNEDDFIFVKIAIEKEAVLDPGGDDNGKTVAIPSHRSIPSFVARL